jgi:cytosine/adenosine deaminase-related metal-dependent hydrolase
VNAHTHIADSVAKELYLGKPQLQVVGPGGEKFRALESNSPGQIKNAVKSASVDMLQTGTLAHCDFREGGAAGVDLVRGVLPRLKSIILGRFLKINEFGKVLAKADGVGLPSIDVFSTRVMKKISGRTIQAGKLFAVHVAETAEAQEKSLKRFGKSEVERALELNCSFVVHATHSSEDDILRLKRSGTPVVFCPRANGILGVGEPPIKTALEVGSEFFLGTDNVMACQPNMFEEISFTWACLRRSDSSVGSEEARGLLRSATVGPLKLFGLPWGPISEGQKATFIALSKGNNLCNLTDVYSGLVNRARADNVRAIYFDGKIIISRNRDVNRF